MQTPVVIVNMGGPADAQAIRPFLRGIMRDPAILPLPSLLRYPLAERIASKRSPKVLERYNLIGGSSPLLEWTEKQAEQLALAFENANAPRIVTHAYRYCPPMIPDAIDELASQGFTKIDLLPLFPHFTNAMSGSVVLEAQRAADNRGVSINPIPVFGQDEKVLQVWSTYLNKAVEEAGGNARIVFVAHGIPMRNIRKGETYDKQVEASARALAERLPTPHPWSVAYQSKVGPVPWTQPYMEDELQRLAADSSAPIVLMPLSFVADCLETLFDLDHEAKQLCRKQGVESFHRVRVFNDDPAFAEALVSMFNRK